MPGCQGLNDEIENEWCKQCVLLRFDGLIPPSLSLNMRRFRKRFKLVNYTGRQPVSGWCLVNGFHIYRHRCG